MIWQIVFVAEIIWRVFVDTMYSIDTGSLTGCLSVIVSLYIPIAILIYQEFKDERSFNEFEWDKTVLIQEVVHGGQILFAVLASSVSIILWNCRELGLRITLLIVFVIGIIILTKNLSNLFKWFMSDKIGKSNDNNYRQAKKIDFLKSLNPNESLNVWNDLLGSIELENAYLKDYIEIFFDKFSQADANCLWQYEFCLKNNMGRLYYWGPVFQNAVINFAFDAYMNDEGRTDVSYCKRSIVRELVSLLMTKEDKIYLSFQRIFDKKLDSVDCQDALDAVRAFATDVLQSIRSVYNKIPKNSNIYGFEVFPIDKWNIASISKNEDSHANAKAMGLLVAYLELLPSYASTGEEFSEDRVDFLDYIVFGMSGQYISRKMIRIISLFFNKGTYAVQEGEDGNHALVRSFIDYDYHLYFVDSDATAVLNYNPSESEEDRQKKIMEIFSIRREQRYKNTLALMTRVYRFLLDSKEMKKIADAILVYDIEDDNYSYKCEPRILEYNLSNLKDTFDEILAFSNHQ